MNFPFFAFVKNNLLSSIKTFGILFAYTTIGYTIFSIIKSSFLYWLNGPSFAPLNKHCYITGGSQGLGKSLAINLAKMGANVTIVARNKELLHQVVVELNAAKINPTQKFKAIVADVTNLDQSIKAIADATSFMGICPEYVFTIAGASVPGLLLELNTSVYKSQMDLNYMGSVYTVKECVRLMVANKVKGKIVLCSSLAALVGFIGYSAYTPTKCAIKGFAEVLKSELVLYDIDVHCVFPGSIKTKGFEAENLIKPKITRTLEGDDASTPQQVADGLIKGLKHDNCFIVTEFLGDVLLACGIGFVSRNNAVAHHVWAALGTIIAPGLQLYSWYLIFMEKNGEKKKQ